MWLMESYVCQERRLQNFNKRLFFYVIGGKMGEYTRFCVSFAVYVKVSSSAGNASSNGWSVVPKVHQEVRFSSP